MSDDKVVLDLRDEKGRFFTRVSVDIRQFRMFQMAASLRGESMEEFINSAIREYAEAHPITETND